jgi:hypothetical protein
MQTKLSSVWTYEARDLQRRGTDLAPRTRPRALRGAIYSLPPPLLLPPSLHRLIGWGEINKGTIQLQQQEGSGGAFVVPAAAGAS